MKESCINVITSNSGRLQQYTHSIGQIIPHNHKAKIFESAGHSIICRWTLSHSGFAKNKRAKLTAKSKAEKCSKQDED